MEYIFILPTWVQKGARVTANITLTAEEAKALIKGCKFPNGKPSIEGIEAATVRYSGGQHLITVHYTINKQTNESNPSTVQELVEQTKGDKGD